MQERREKAARGVREKRQAICRRRFKVISAFSPILRALALALPHSLSPLSLPPTHKLKSSCSRVFKGGQHRWATGCPLGNK